MNELGQLLRELRGKLSLRDAAKLTGLSHTYISDVEKGMKHDTKAPIKPSPDTLKSFSKAYNYPYEKLLEKAGYIDISKKKNNDLPELNAKDEKDIAKKMESILKEMDSDTALAFDGEPLDEETKELVRAAIESNLILTKQIAKKKFTPKKYRKE